MKIGANVSISGTGLLAAVQEAISYQANTLMIYTRPNRGGRHYRKIEDFYIKESVELMEKNNLNIKDFVVHAPYIINIAGNEDTRKIGIEVLKEEVQRTEALGIPYLVFHPGAHVGAGVEKGIEYIADSLNQILHENQKVFVCLETMAGDGTKVGNTLEEIAAIIDKIHLKEKIGVCLDTCHNWSVGYDIVNNFDRFLSDFEQKIGLKYLKVAHINGSKGGRGERKDRHANIGASDDTIGKEALRYICQHPIMQHIPLILETPLGQYKEEIKYLRGNNDAELASTSFNTKTG